MKSKYGIDDGDVARDSGVFGWMLLELRKGLGTWIMTYYDPLTSGVYIYIICISTYICTYMYIYWACSMVSSNLPQSYRTS